MKHKVLLESLDRAAVVSAIERAERASSGEIRVHVDPSSHGKDPLFLAERTLERLRMTRTALRNGVLIYLVSKEQQFAVVGDRGIHEKVGPEFWEVVASHMVEHFRKGEFTEGVVQAVEEVGEQLRHHFPHAGGKDENELSNEISLGDGEPPRP